VTIVISILWSLVKTIGDDIYEWRHYKSIKLDREPSINCSQGDIVTRMSLTYPTSSIIGKIHYENITIYLSIYIYIYYDIYIYIYIINKMIRFDLIRGTRPDICEAKSVTIDYNRNNRSVNLSWINESDATIVFIQTKSRLTKKKLKVYNYIYMYL